MQKTKKTSESIEEKENFKKFKSFLSNRQVQTVSGVFIFLLGIFLAISFVSFFFSWKEDQSLLTEFCQQTRTSSKSIRKNRCFSKLFLYLQRFWNRFFYDSIVAYVDRNLFAFTHQTQKSF